MAELLQLVFLVLIAALGLGVLVYARLVGVRSGRGGSALPAHPEALEWLDSLADVHRRPEPELS